MPMFTPLRRPLIAAVAAAALVTLAGCSSTSTTTPDTHTSAMATMPGMDQTSNGLSATKDGLTLRAVNADALASGVATSWQFTITGADGKPITSFTPEQTKLMHFYAVREDLTGYQHVHPTMSPDGTWTADLTALQPSRYRFYTQFTANGAGGHEVTPVLSVPVTVDGKYTPASLPAPSTTAEVDGYTITMKSGSMMAGMEMPLTITISKDGQLVTDLQPYLGSYAHLTAIHFGDLSFAHLHPGNPVTGDHGGPELDFQAMLPQSGDWRLFIQFQTAGTLHVAAITLHV